MSDSDRPKPLPARPPSQPSASDSPAGSDPIESAPPSPSAALPAPAAEPPAEEEVGISWRGGTWVARVLGRSGRAEARSASLMLVGFWRRESAAEAPSLEGIVPGRRLEDVPEEVLQATLARAKAPPVAGQRPPFFDDADPTRRSGPASEY